MKISRTMLRNHLRGVTVNYFNHHNVAPVYIGDYAKWAPSILESAEKNGDLPWFKLGLASVLNSPLKSCEDLNGGTYTYGHQELYDLIEVDNVQPSNGLCPL